MPTDVKVPTLGESITEATIGQWLKQPGDAVAADEPIASLETDKVSVEVNAPAAGTLTEQLAKEGDTVEVGALIARIGESGSSAKAGAQAEAPASEPSETKPAAPGPQTSPGNESNDAALRLSPAVRRAVLENHIDPSAIKGSGKDGRLTKDDVIAAASAKSSPAQAEGKAPDAGSATPASQSAPASTGDRTEERIKMSRLRQTIAQRLKDAQNTAALLTTFNDVDMSAVIDARARYKDLFEK
jgi:2-oxoglutarate dehydrogenase E2 component (dihydrolipoamide succinyltransferase)